MTERTEQSALFDWAAWQVNMGHEALRYMFAIPNGGLRDKIAGGQLKAEGVKPGVPDIFLPWASQGYHGLFIEMKVGSNRPTKEQLEFLTWLSKAGYLAVVAIGFDEAKMVIERYLEI